MRTRSRSAYEVEHHYYNKQFKKVMSWKQYGLILDGAPFRDIPIILN